MSPSRLTIHARICHSKALGTTYVGFIRIQDSLAHWTESTQIHRLTRTDALIDAEKKHQDFLQQSHNA